VYERERSVQERLLKARAAEPLKRILVGGSHIIFWREVFEQVISNETNVTNYIGNFPVVPIGWRLAQSP